MTKQAILRDEFLGTLRHIKNAYTRVKKNSGKGQVLTFPDAHKIAEGLFLSAWTRWEEFLRELFIEDLATVQDGCLLSDIKEFRTKGAARRLAERIVSHPDIKKWVEWSDFREVNDRATTLLGSTNRFSTSAIIENDLIKIKRIRNAVAHKSDHAWRSFINLTKDKPFSLTNKQRKGLTVGRFLRSNQWDGKTCLFKCLLILRANAKALVP